MTSTSLPVEPPQPIGAKMLWEHAKRIEHELQGLRETLDCFRGLDEWLTPPDYGPWRPVPPDFGKGGEVAIQRQLRRHLVTLVQLVSQHPWHGGAEPGADVPAESEALFATRDRLNDILFGLSRHLQRLPTDAAVQETTAMGRNVEVDDEFYHKCESYRFRVDHPSWASDEEVARRYYPDVESLCTAFDDAIARLEMNPELRRELLDQSLPQLARDCGVTDCLQVAAAALSRRAQATNEVRQEHVDATPPRPKKSTAKGDAKDKLIAGLTRHHDYAGGSCLNLSPIGNNALARRVGVSNSSASSFFNDNFGGYKRYRVRCMDNKSITDDLKSLNGEFTPIKMAKCLDENAAAVRRQYDD